ncbi:MAG: sugar transferase [Calditrichaeota bacterium]|nr:MAG: sugar transferase [Calditrichota bacterium]
MNNLYLEKSNSTLDLIAGKESQTFCAEDTQSLEPILAAPIPAWKRTVDLLGASLAILLLFPLFILSILIIKIVSPGPVLFKQIRTGYLGKSFVIWKFRTMHLNADSGLHATQIRNEIKNDLELKKVENDPRIFPFGNFLRNSCIDELPQLINVIRGEMSLVGPRPELPYAVDEFQRWHCARLDVLPGMTGLWQINGKNSTTFTEMIRYDIEYGQQLSFTLEIKILLLTIPAILKQVWQSMRN